MDYENQFSETKVTRQFSTVKITKLVTNLLHIYKIYGHIWRSHFLKNANQLKVIMKPFQIFHSLSHTHTHTQSPLNNRNHRLHIITSM